MTPGAAAGRAASVGPRPPAVPALRRLARTRGAAGPGRVGQIPRADRLEPDRRTDWELAAARRAGADSRDAGRHPPRSARGHQSPPPSPRRRPRCQLVLLSLPPVVLSLALLFVAARTGWFPVGGLPPGGGAESLRYFVLPVLALGLPIAASLERLQSRSMAQALRHPSVLAARAPGSPSAALYGGTPSSCR